MPANLWFSGIFRRYRTEALARNRLTTLTIFLQPVHKQLALRGQIA